MSIDSLQSFFILPDTLLDWPWKRTINPHYPQVKAESSAWIRNFTLTPRVQVTFDLCDFAHLASLGYPSESKDVLRAGSDLMHLLFLFDEYTDVATPSEVQEIADMVMDAIYNPDKPRPAGECVVGEVARQFWKTQMKSISVGARRRFIKTLGEYTTSIVEQAQDRAQNHIRNIDDYLLVRRDTSGVKPTFVVLEFGLNLPDEVFEDPVIQRLVNACIGMIMLGNDLYSYNVEQARYDEDHNIVTVLMHQENIGLNEAMKWIGDYHSKLMHTFLNDLNHVPSFGEDLQAQVIRYLDGMATWVRANDCWSFESLRYFGTSGLEIQQSRKVVLLSR